MGAASLASTPQAIGTAFWFYRIGAHAHSGWLRHRRDC